jgi:VWFA-related protein
MKWLTSSIGTSLVSVTVAVAAGGGALSIASQQQGTQPVFRSSVTLTQIDVSVLDKNHRPVHGLTAADFTILEDGVPRPIEVLTPVDLPEEAAPQGAAWTREVTPDVTTNTVAMDGRVFVIVMDDALMPANSDMNHAGDLWPIEATRKMAASVVNRLRPDDLAAVVFTLDGHGAQGLTGDRTLLLKAVNSLARTGNTTAHPDGRTTSPTDPPCAAYLQSISVVRDAALYLAALPQRRKSVVYISGGMAVDLSTQKILGALYPGRPLDRTNCGTSVVASMKETFRDAQAANVAIYGFDPMGLRPNAALNGAEGSIVQFVQTVSENTGGRATVNTNDFEPGIAQMYLENGSYYLLGYQSDSGRATGPKQLKVTVRQPGLEVRTRHEVWTTPAAVSKEKATSAAITAPSPSGILPNMDTPLRVAAMPALRRGQATPTLAVVLGVSQPLPEQGRQEVLEVTVRAFTRDGEPRGSHSETVTLALTGRSAANDRVTYEVASALDLKPGQYELRVYAHNKTTGVDGSVYATVDVPDFSKTRASLSGVFANSKPGLPMLAKQMIDGWLTNAPTTQRDYSKSDSVTAGVFVYQGSSATLVPIPISATLLNDRGDVVHRDSATLALSDFTPSRSAVYSIAPPLDGLTPGSYLLTFSLGDGHGGQTRDMRFTVR